ncbi:MAG: hypothetical protein RLZZ399_461 [Verrucomicrobiota bacterium]|jgi:hypothetical protein
MKTILKSLFRKAPTSANLSPNKPRTGYSQTPSKTIPRRSELLLDAISNEEEEIKSRLSSAKRAMIAENLPLARANFEWVLQRRPSDLSARLGLRWVKRQENGGIDDPDSSEEMP